MTNATLQPMTLEIRFRAERYSDLVSQVEAWLRTENAQAGVQPAGTPAHAQAAPVPMEAQTVPAATPSSAYPVQHPGNPAVQMAPYPPVVPVAQPSPLPTAAPSYQLEDLMRAASTLADVGRSSEVQALMAEFGVPTMTALPPEQYGPFALRLRGMGAQL